MKSTVRPHIVVAGGGFAGLQFIKRIDRKKFRVTLIDQNNYNAFSPLFYQVASSGLEPASICFPFRQELRGKKGIHFHLGRICRIDRNRRQITTENGIIEYDYLVIATGTGNNFFNINRLQEKAFTLKSVAEAIRLRNEILSKLERACLCTITEERKTLLSFAVIGGGPSGVEIAGALGEMKKYILKRDYPELSPTEVRITLVEGAARLLRNMHPYSSKKAQEYLSQLGVEIVLNANMLGYENEWIQLDGGNSFRAGTLIWTAGVSGERLNGIPDNVWTRGNRIPVDRHCHSLFDRQIFAIGDIASMSDEKYPNGHPQVAPVAIQQARYLADLMNSGKFGYGFHYHDNGSMATIGRNRAVAELPHASFHGSIAWFCWMFVHLLSLLGMRNKAATLMNWIWNYFTYNSSLRLLIRPTRYPNRG